MIMTSVPIAHLQGSKDVNIFCFRCVKQIGCQHIERIKVAHIKKPSRIFLESSDAAMSNRYKINYNKFSANKCVRRRTGRKHIFLKVLSILHLYEFD